MSPEDSGQATTPVPMAPDSLLPTEDPAADEGPATETPMRQGNLRIGRAPDNDLVVDDLIVSRYHAELRGTPDGHYEITDLGSPNGTYVNGRRVSVQLLSDSDTVGVGRSTFRLTDGRLRQFLDDGDVTVAAQDLVVTVAGGKVLLDRVSFAMPEKCLVGVIGPSGAGKSTLLGAMTGMRPADTGTVLYDNRDLYQDYAELRHRIGLVPQENILHTQLTARRALQYSAELRFPADTTAAERNARVAEVMEELGLAKHAETRADRLSGGHLVVTHSVLNLLSCDRLLILAPGGRMAFYGPPGEALGYFGLPDWAELFQAFDNHPDRDWADEFAESLAYAR